MPDKLTPILDLEQIFGMNSLKFNDVIWEFVSDYTVSGDLIINLNSLTTHFPEEIAKIKLKNNFRNNLTANDILYQKTKNGKHLFSLLSEIQKGLKEEADIEIYLSKVIHNKTNRDSVAIVSENVFKEKLISKGIQFINTLEVIDERELYAGIFSR